ncbi:MAG: hypothetical protein WBC74_02885 [Candidatus Omnitrophota bacterium]
MEQKNTRFLVVFVLIALMITLSAHKVVNAAIDREKLERTKKLINSMDREEKLKVMARVEERKYRYTISLPNFNGKVNVDERDEFGQVLKKETIVLALGKGIKAPLGVAVGDKEISWKDVARYEKTLLETHDPVNKWFVENLWRARINRALKLLAEKAKKEYPKDYKKIDFRVRDIAIALGIPVPKNGPPIGPLTNQPFLKDGNQLHKIDQEYIDLTLDVFMNNMDEWMREFWQHIIVNLDGATNFQQ